MKSWTGVSNLATTALGDDLNTAAFLAMASAPGLVREARSDQATEAGAGDAALITQREPVLARVRAADQQAAGVIEHDHLAAAERSARWHHPVAAPGEPFGRRTRNAAFQAQLAVLGEGAR